MTETSDQQWKKYFETKKPPPGYRIEYFCDACKTFFNVEIEEHSERLHCPYCSGDSEKIHQLKKERELYEDGRSN